MHSGHSYNRHDVWFEEWQLASLLRPPFSGPVVLQKEYELQHSARSVNRHEHIAIRAQRVHD